MEDMSGTAWRVLNVLGCGLFAAFAWLQREDDNPDIYASPSLADVWTWIALYGLVSVLFLLAALRRFPWPVLVVAAALCVFELWTTAPGILRNLAGGDFTLTKASMNPEHAEVEQSREFLGVVIALASLGFIAWQRRIFLAGTRKPAVMEG